ncbi:acid protease [Tilletiaria anomala UBC 951]|uniref:Acid protease n=1 Tax=Tilletiaria anomala (strain ATCC 24038 / CBS 436.72 / UBC 951) TaxID=1037660 RepID=A0A066WIX7_TILAU|nr:acid protease [Tilletiaria anomala UBC 951]KDN52503.1 acid protease [Tilletiaria anomala UBC 951]
MIAFPHRGPILVTIMSISALASQAQPMAFELYTSREAHRAIAARSPSSQRLNVQRDPFHSLFDLDEGLLLPNVAAVLSPRYRVSTQSPHENRHGVLSLSLMTRSDPHAPHSRRKRHAAKTKRLLSTGAKSLDAASLFKVSKFIKDQGWGVYTAQTSNTENDNEWLVEVGFGTPPQHLKVVFDTGSPDTWTYSPDCCYLSNHDYFNPSSSSTYTNRTVDDEGNVEKAEAGAPGEAWKISYGGGSTTQGYIGMDTFTFSDGALQVPSLPLALATQITGTSRASRAMEGLVGLSNGAASPAAGGWTTPLEALARDGKLQHPYLTASLVKGDRRTGQGGGGSYILGDLDTVYQDGPVIWSDVTSSIYWGTSYDDMRIGGQSIIPSNQTRAMIMDTGSALINLPPAAARRANDRIQGSTYSDTLGYWLVPCDTGLPEYESTLSTKNQEFILEVNSHPFAVPTEDFVFYPNLSVPAKSAGGQDGMCISAFQQGPEQFSIVGLTFIKNHAVTFDIGNGQRRVGIANRTDTGLA